MSNGEGIFKYLNVAPFTGAWIEISPSSLALLIKKGRTLHGCVD